MASKEHKNLSNANLHAPLDFSTAANDTILTKNSSGSLEWSAKSNIKTTVLNIRGFGESGTLNTNYFFPADMADTKSPFEFDEDYGSATISSSNTITVSKVIRGTSYTAPKACTLTQVTGWMTGSQTETVTLALVKFTPTANDSSAFEVGASTNVMTVLDEISVSTYGSNNKLGSIDETTFTVADVAKGDMIMPFIKSAGGSSNIYFNITLEFNYTN